MPYIGKEPVRGQNRELDDISGSFNGGTAAFTMQVGGVNTSAGSVNQLFISVGGIMQNPGTDFTVSSSTITFTTPPANGLDFWGLIQGDAVDINTPADGSVTSSKIASGNLTLPGDLTIPDKIIHDGDTNTAIRFPDADTVSVETGGGESFRIDSSKRFLKGVTSSEASRSNTSARNPHVQLSSPWSSGLGSTSITCTDDYPILFLNSNSTFQDNAGSGVITWSVKDGAGNYCNTAEIRSQIDGTPGNNDSPGELSFRVTADGSCQPTERLKIHSNGNVEINDGDLIIGGTGHGIDFSGSQTNAGGMTSETLDSYEEGTWTPTAGTLSGPNLSGEYTKIGRLVFVKAFIGWSSHSNTGTDTISIGGLPFTPSGAGYAYIGDSRFINLDSNMYSVGIYMDSSGVVFRENGDNQGAEPLKWSQVGNDTYFGFAGFYKVA